jgi:Beta-galactosidase/beta-glucuronidase
MPFPGLTALPFCFFLIACHHPPAITGAPKKVEVKKAEGVFRIYKNGKPFLIKGGSGFTHLRELAACGGNTIRTWDTTHLQSILDEAHHYGLAAIVGLDLPVSTLLDEFYCNKQKTDSVYSAYQSIVRRFKNHPALLVWCLGNEIDFPYRPRFAAFYKTFNRLVAMIHEEDPDHPVTTTLTNFQKRNIVNIKLKVRGLDFISINTFNPLKTLEKDLQHFKWFWDGPYLITEWSPEGGWETQVVKWLAPIENTSTKKAELFRDFYQNYLPHKDPRFLGSLAFYWGWKEEYTHSWFSIFNEDGTPTEIVETLRDCWRDTVTHHQAVQLQYMLLDGKGAADNILLSPGSTHQASLLLAPGEHSDSLCFHWEIIREDWWGHKKSHWTKPPAEQGLLIDSTTLQVAFRSPLKEGPYRIFVTAFNAKGFCATANTPFYVVE